MEQTQFKVYGYRWIVLLVFMFVVAINQLLWITFASVNYIRPLSSRKRPSRR